MQAVSTVVSTVTICFGMAIAAYGSTVVPLDPAATYLRTNADPGALDAPAINLASLSIFPGETLLIEEVGSFMYASNFFSPSTETIGVFSSSNVLLPSSNLNRVPGAIDVGMPWPTIPTLQGGLPTDIPQDFHITTTTVTVPTGAAYLFVSAHDSWYSDNSDPNGDYGVRLTVTPEPSSVMLAAVGIFALLAWGCRNKPQHMKASP